MTAASGDFSGAETDLDVVRDRAWSLHTSMAEFCEDGWFLDRFHLLCRGLIHSTTWQNFVRIIECGWVRPGGAIHGLPFAFPGSSERSHGFRSGSVCLFDFERPTLDEVVTSRRAWEGVLLRSAAAEQDDAVVLLQWLEDMPGGEVRRQPGSKCTQCDCDLATGRHTCPPADRDFYIPSVECWHQGPLSIESLDEVHIVNSGVKWARLYAAQARTLARSGEELSSWLVGQQSY